MIIDDLDFVRIAITPYKTDPPLVVDPYAVLALTIAGEFLEPLSWWNPKIPQRLGIVQHRELPTRDILDAPKPRTALAIKQRFGVFAPERPYHLARVLRTT
jgi:hypothetical protein